jgi:hypothetical protein
MDATQVAAQIRTMTTRPRIIGAMAVTRVGGGFKVTGRGEIRIYATADETATAVTLGRHTSAGRVAR